MSINNYNNLPVQPINDIEKFSLTQLIMDDWTENREGLICREELSASQKDGNEKLITEQDLALLFVDVRDYTGLLQSGSQREAVQMIKRILDLFSKIVAHFGGTIVNRAGDSLYVAYGLDRDIQSAANNALQSTSKVFELLNKINDQFMIEKLGHPLEIGVGLHTGNVVVEYARSTDEPLSIMGMPVNIAARLQEETKHSNNDLIISSELYELLSEESKSAINPERKMIQVSGVKAIQNVWLAGKQYVSELKKQVALPNLEYLLAIAG